MRTNSLRLCTTIAVLASAAPALAVPLSFTLTGTKNASFILDSNPTPDTFSTSSLIGNQIGFNSVAGTFGGTPGVASVSFGTNLLASLNIGFTGFGFTQLSGANLFSGPGSSPVFSTGTFALSNPFFGDNVTLRITALTSAAPEPGTWAMMILGFGLAGASLRYRRRSTSITYA